MILNENINKIIKFMMELNEDFQKDYLYFINRLPEKIKRKFRLCIPFEDVDLITGNSYSLYHYKEDENYMEIDVTFDNEEYLLDLDLEKISIKEILNLKQELYDEFEKFEVNEFAGFTYTIDDNNRVDYSFEIHRKTIKKFIITSKRIEFENINTKKLKIVSEEKEHKEITFDELMNKLKINNRRF